MNLISRATALFFATIALLGSVACNSKTKPVEEVPPPSSVAPAVEMSDPVPPIESFDETTSDSSATETAEMDIPSFAAPIQTFYETFPSATLTKVKFKRTFPQSYFEIEGVDETSEYELAISLNGDLMSQKTERLDFDDQNDRELKGFEFTEDFLSPQEAVMAAFAAVNKTPNTDPLECQLERQLGNMVYKVEFDSINNDLEVHLDATTGNVLSIDD